MGDHDDRGVERLMALGEVSFGGVGSGLYGLVIFAIVAVFIAGLMVGRTPELLGKKIEAYEMKMASWAILVPVAAVLLGTAFACLAGETYSKALGNHGPHGFSEVLYAFISQGNNNGSAFAGLTANGTFFATAGGICMWVARFWIIIPTLAIAGSLARKKIVPPSSGTLPTAGPLFVCLLAVFTLLCGFVYPFVMDGIAAGLFPHQATGSLIRDERGHIDGSELIGQPFDSPAYFWSRPTAEASYDASNSTSTNQGQSAFVDDKGHLGPNPTLTRNAQARIAALHAADPTNTAPVPVDLVTASSSGLDPHISPEAAFYQVARVAKARGQSEEVVRALVEDHLEGRTFGVLGEPRVNVLLLNRALDGR